ncbi:hypothetical protein J8L98_24160 [Pseudoalteromonas sp. MMG013]|uniref:hypothetical protein n=1 Tax=Pseudoalteromonas sp. MMG013 TaxID=2822687 RepID=UPI001B37ECD6|nr:hypothetical protein [Pseudoalteromonas sp. MMG013]MBQ4864784.1 hypothetical protein [Pseudoalteromonas sp. MMG013]
MKKLFSTVVVVSFAVSSTLLSSFSFASDMIAVCNACSEQQMQNRAIQYAPNGGKVHIIDIHNNKVSAYQTEREEGLVMYWAIPVKESIRAGVTHVRNAKNTIEDLAQGSVNIEHLRPFLGAYSDINTAHTVAKYAPQKAAIKTALSDYFTGNIAGAITSASVSLGTAIVNQALTVNLAVNVHFPSDGTTYAFMFKGIIKNLNGDVSVMFEPIIDSGRDKGIRLHESHNYIGYRARGVSDALQRILNHMLASGVAVTLNGNPLPTGTVTITDVVCSNEPGKGCNATE